MSARRFFSDTSSRLIAFALVGAPFGYLGYNGGPSPTPIVYLKYIGCGGPLDRSPEAKDPRIEVRFGKSSVKPLYLTHFHLYQDNKTPVSSIERLMEKEPSKSFEVSYEWDRMYGSMPFCWTRPGFETLYVIRPVSTENHKWVSDFQRFAYQNNLHFKIKYRGGKPSWLPSCLFPEDTTEVGWHR